mmetsp:Transcript_31462/g.80197  ORF Transcript_31462/g.80197 Transcript_31462/m.80197 type:complete len:354 (-) Transcript_31462:193-1254(-)
MGAVLAVWQGSPPPAGTMPLVGDSSPAPSRGRALRAAEGSAAASTTVSVMSFNLRYDNSGDHSKGCGWQVRRQRAASLLLEAGADIVGTQEGLRHQLQQLRHDLLVRSAAFGYVGAARDLLFNLLPNGEHCAIFHRLASVSCHDSSTFALSETPERLGSRSWGSACPRIATAAWFCVRPAQGASVEGDSPCILVLNTHLDHMSELARQEGARLIVERLGELERRGPPAGLGHLAGTVVTGDFNCWELQENGSCSSTFQVFHEAGFRDACSAAGAGNCPFLTFHDWHAEQARANVGAPPKLRNAGVQHGHIDWILYRGPNLKLLDFQVLTSNGDAGDWPPPSDHFPVIARFEVT